jgi:putative transposase
MAPEALLAATIEPWCSAGFLFLAVVLDACTRRIVGWAMANHLRTELVLDALNMALHQRRPTNVIRTVVC